MGYPWMSSRGRSSAFWAPMVRARPPPSSCCWGLPSHRGGRRGSAASTPLGTREPLKVKRLVGYLPENVGFYQDMSARENLRYVARLNHIPDRVSSHKIDEVLGIVGLSEDAQKRVGTFSRGMSQRLGIAEVLIKDPRVCFLDEPTLGLDPDGAIRMIELIQSLSRERTITMLVSSHNLEQVQKISHRVGIMIKGKLVAVGPMQELANEKLGVGKQKYTLEQIYMKYFHEV